MCGACAFRYTEAAAASAMLANVPTKPRAKQHGLTRGVGRPGNKTPDSVQYNANHAGEDLPESAACRRQGSSGLPLTTQVVQS